jgi:hypothetical protein
LIETTKDEAIPKKKFKFERKTKTKKVEEVKKVEAVAQATVIASNNLAIKGHRGERLVKV